MQGCIFCEIVNGQKPARIVYQDGTATAFWTINPVAPVHILIIPNMHITSLGVLTLEHHATMGYILGLVPAIAKDVGVNTSGYRVIINTGTDAGQSVDHLHLHLIGGRRLPFAG